jgi:hypothetical protein
LADRNVPLLCNLVGLEYSFLNSSLSIFYHKGAWWPGVFVKRKSTNT